MLSSRLAMHAASFAGLCVMASGLKDCNGRKRRIGQSFGSKSLDSEFWKFPPQRDSEPTFPVPFSNATTIAFHSRREIDFLRTPKVSASSRSKRLYISVLFAPSKVLTPPSIYSVQTHSTLSPPRACQKGIFRRPQHPLDVMFGLLPQIFRHPPLILLDLELGQRQTRRGEIPGPTSAVDRTRTPRRRRRG